MEINEKLAYCYWEFLAITQVTDRLKGKGILNDDVYAQNIILQAQNRLGLDESIEQLTDKSYKVGFEAGTRWRFCLFGKSNITPIFLLMRRKR